MEDRPKECVLAPGGERVWRVISRNPWFVDSSAAELHCFTLLVLLMIFAMEQRET